jgi:hypothetical protein
MAKRLQVILQDTEYREVQRSARSRRMSTAEWVRQALLHARLRESSGDVEKKLQAVREAARHNFPTADIETMLEEIERGYSDGQPK